MRKLVIYILDLAQFSSGGKAIAEARSFLPQLQLLGVTHIWVLPFYPSGRYDYGYDVEECRGVDPRFGTLDDFVSFVEAAHSLGMKVWTDLVLNHTSIDHPWFRERSYLYYWTDQLGYCYRWENLFDPKQPAWQYDTQSDQFYASLFDPHQADLRWFPSSDEIPNCILVDSFREIVEFWLSKNVDGFRLDAIQAMNKNAGSELVNMSTLLNGTRCLNVVKHIFGGMTTYQGTPPELLVELIDPDFSLAPTFVRELGNVVGEGRVWIESTTVKDAPTLRGLREAIKKSEKSPNVLRCLGNHDSCRLSSRPYVNGNQKTAIALMFSGKPHGIMVPCGQELGLINPPLLDGDHLRLDAMLRKRHSETPGSVALTKEEKLFSRANGRIPPPEGWFDAYGKQLSRPDSPLHQYIDRIHGRW